ncbi:cytochrome P450 [Aspergillus fijiensis CBS 313.89]|uniref:Cytochrome P450 n=1 Tax=Aspergillus fijiensis CBS 313.89 TaxID=1448319 RepID=A0A8G1RG46_9EURO|nr:cytochrome P450 [Aspergillus fijiensis CBS 313.89]RAK71513.1 cytochrome P450 [Aspergillus fijiensis CBS 313.89]
MTLLWILETTAVVLLLWTAVEAIRRLYFHPIAHIPGPRLAALTWWYEFYYDAIQPGQYVFKIQELHKRYGPIIRVTPDGIHINDSGFLDTVYAPAMVRRDKYDYQLRSLRIPGGVGTTAGYHLHRLRWESLTHFFSKKNILHLEGLITDKVEQLKQLIATHVADNTPVNLSDAFFSFFNDVVTNFLFAHLTDILSNESKAVILRQNSKELLMGINLNKHFPWIPDFLESLPLSISRPMMPPGLVDMLALFDSATNSSLSRTPDHQQQQPPPLNPWAQESVFDSVLDAPNLPDAEKTLPRLEREGTLLALAGTESPAQTLTVAFYHLLANPALLAKLRQELRTVPAPASWTQLEQLPYLSAVIEESNRLSFGPNRPHRLRAVNLHAFRACCPITVQPSRTTTLSAHTAETVFPEPWVFDPDRWLGDAGRKRRRFQMAVGKGGRRCLGIELARAELFLVIAGLVRAFEMTLFETGEEDVAFRCDYQVAMPGRGSRGVRVRARARMGVGSS